MIIINRLFGHVSIQFLLCATILFPSTDAWPMDGMWTRLGGPDGYPIIRIAIDPNNVNNLYATSPDGSMFVSHDRAEHWDQILDQYWSTSVAAIDNNGLTTVARSTGASVGYQANLITSTDAGASWTPLSDTSLDVTFNCVDLLQSAGSLYCGGVDGGTGSGQLWKSSDLGSHWQLQSSQLDANNWLIFETLFSWEDFLMAPRTFAFDSLDSAIVYAKSQSQDSRGRLKDTVYLSRDGGINWSEPPNKGLVNGVWSGIVTTAANSAIYTFGSKGLYRSLDNAGTWRKIFKDKTVRDVIALPDQVTVIAGTNKGIYRSIDNGIHWSPLLYLPVAINAFANVPEYPQMLFSATNQGIAISMDSGATWSEKNAGIKNSNIGDISASGQIIYILGGILENTLYRSTDGGENWNKLATTIAFSKIETTSGDIVYAIGTKGKSTGLYKSTDGGETWTFLMPNATKVIVNPDNSSDLYVVNSKSKKLTLKLWRYKTDNSGDIIHYTERYPTEEVEIKKSKDGGVTWTSLKTIKSSFDRSSDAAHELVTKVKLSVHPDNFDSLIACIDYIYPANEVDPHWIYVVKSMDGGANWVSSDVIVAPKILQTTQAYPRLKDVYIDKWNEDPVVNIDSKVYRATGVKPYRRWENLISQNLTNLVIDPVVPNVLYSVLNGQVSKSVDNGKSWLAMSDGLPVARSNEYQTNRIYLDQSVSQLPLFSASRGQIYKYDLHP